MPAACGPFIPSWHHILAMSTSIHMEEYDFVASRADEAFVDALAASTKKAYDGKNDGYLNHSRLFIERVYQFFKHYTIALY
jgi:hypothetical protein